MTSLDTWHLTQTIFTVKSFNEILAPISFKAKTGTYETYTIIRIVPTLSPASTAGAHAPSQAHTVVSSNLYRRHDGQKVTCRHRQLTSVGSAHQITKYNHLFHMNVMLKDWSGTILFLIIGWGSMHNRKSVSTSSFTRLQMLPITESSATMVMPWC